MGKRLVLKQWRLIKSYEAFNPEKVDYRTLFVEAHKQMNEAKQSAEKEAPVAGEPQKTTKEAKAEKTEEPKPAETPKEGPKPSESDIRMSQTKLAKGLVVLSSQELQAYHQMLEGIQSQLAAKQIDMEKAKEYYKHCESKDFLFHFIGNLTQQADAAIKTGKFDTKFNRWAMDLQKHNMLRQKLLQKEWISSPGTYKSKLTSSGEFYKQLEAVLTDHLGANHNVALFLRAGAQIVELQLKAIVSPTSD